MPVSALSAPIKGPQALKDERAAELDLVIIRECTEGLFYTAAVHNRSPETNADEAQETLRLTRPITERLCDFAFTVAERRKAQAKEVRSLVLTKQMCFRRLHFSDLSLMRGLPSFPPLPRAIIMWMHKLLIWLKNPGTLMFW